MDEGREQRRRGKRKGGENNGCKWQRISGREEREKDRKGKAEGDKRERKEQKGWETIAAGSR